MSERSGGGPPQSPPDVRSRATVGSDRAAWGAFGLLGVLLAVYLGDMAVRRNWQFSPLRDGWLVIGFQAVACTLCVAGGLRASRRRRVILIMGLACISWTVGDVLFTVESLGGATPPTPSLSDLFWFAFFPLAFASVILFVRGELTRGDAPNWLDGAIAALGMAAVCSSLALRGLEHLLAHASAASITNLAFPVADVVLLAFVVGSTIFLTGRNRATLVLIAFGIAVNAAGDTINFIQPASGASQFSNVLNAVAWPFSIWMFAMAMRVAERGSGRFALQRLSGFGVPAMLTLGCLCILVLDNWSHVPAPAAVLAALTLVVAGVRLAFRPALRLARAQLRSSEERYRILFEQNPLPMATYDRGTRAIVAASNAMVARYGYSREELYAMTVDDLRGPPEGRAPLAAERGVLPGEDSGEPMRHRRKDGTLIDVEVTSDEVAVNGRDCVIALFIDVTERNRMAAEAAMAHDRAVEASNMKSAFLANVSHEIRTPMNGVLGMTELLLDMDLAPEQRECAQQVGRSGEQMLAIINDILDISKIESGHLELDVDDFDLWDAVEQTCSAASALAGAKALALEVKIGERVPRAVRGDGRRFRQVLENLLSNAIKFTPGPGGTVSVRVSATPARDDRSLIHVDVADSGIGIDHANLQRMFEPFMQADVSTTRVYGGTGLGLAIAREIVDLMGGTISAESTPGGGSTFWFEVELAPPAASAITTVAIAPDSAPSPSWGRTPSVLLVEDSQINQIVVSRALERCGCRVNVVGDGEDALRALATQQFDAVLMDCQMPGMDGYQATAELRRREHGLRHTPVIAMTAHAMAGDRERCIDAGMDDYITKPVRHPDLQDALRRWIPDQVEPAHRRSPDRPAMRERHAADGRRVLR